MGTCCKPPMPTPLTSVSWQPSFVPDKFCCGCFLTSRKNCWLSFPKISIAKIQENFQTKQFESKKLHKYRHFSCFSWFSAWNLKENDYFCNVFRKRHDRLFAQSLHELPPRKKIKSNTINNHWGSYYKCGFPHRLLWAVVGLWSVWRKSALSFL